MIKRAAAMMAPVLTAMALNVSADPLSRCGLDVTRERNTAELACYMENGPKSSIWAVANQAPLDACLGGVQYSYNAALLDCNARYATREVGEPVDPHKATVYGAGIATVILLAF